MARDLKWILNEINFALEERHLHKVDTLREVAPQIRKLYSFDKMVMKTDDVVVKTQKEDEWQTILTNDMYFIIVDPDVPHPLFQEDFSSYDEDTTISSGATPFRIIYNGSGDGNQKIIVTEKPDGTQGKVLQCQGTSSWGCRIRHDITVDNNYRYKIIECDIKTTSGSAPGGVDCGSSKASGSWTHAVFGMDFANGKINTHYNDSSQTISDSSYETGVWYHLKLVYDTVVLKQYVYLDNILLNPDGNTISNVQVEWFDCTAGNIGGNTVYFSNINVYEYGLPD